MNTSIETASDRTEFVRRWINSHNYSYPQAAEILGVSTHTIGRYFIKESKHKRSPSWEIICKIKILGN